MTAPSQTPQPPTIDGAPQPTPRDVLRAVWWGRRAWSLSSRSGPVRHRCYAAALAVLWWPLLPLIVIIQFYEGSRSTIRFYMTVERDVILGVHANRHGWRLIDHIAAKPGTGRGHVLRQVVFPDLAAAADQHGITIRTTAANQQLALRYIEDLPGLIDVGPAPHGRRRLLRNPRNQGLKPLRSTPSTPAANP